MAVHFALNIKPDASQDHAEVPENPLSYLQGTNGATVVLIHGLTGSPHEIGFIARSLNKNGFSVACPRLANHGKHLNILRNTTWEEFYESVKETIQNLPGDGPVFVSGLSVGALLALKSSIDFPDRVSGVCCLSPIFFYDGWNAPKWRHWLPLAFHTPLKNFFYFKEEPPYGIKNEAIMRRIDQHYKDKKLQDKVNAHEQGYPFYPLSLLYQHDRLINHLKSKLHLVKAPVQMIQAFHDDMSSPKNSQFIYDRISSIKKEIYLLFNCYHVVCADQERMTVFLQMERFFNQIKEAKVYA